MISPYHIVILSSRLDMPGGIERVVVNTANLFNKKGLKVTILILDDTPHSFYAIEQGVGIEHHTLSFGITPEGNVLSRKLKLLSDVIKLRRILLRIKPDFIISSEYPFTIAALLTRIKKHSCLLAWEHHHYNWLEKNAFWETMFKLAYPRLHGIICLNKTEAALFANHGETFVIPNFVATQTAGPADNRTNTILSVSWLIPRKGIDLLLKIAKDILTKYPGWNWKLIGDGEMKEDVMQFKSSEAVGDRLIWQSPGETAINEEYKQVSLFALTSRFEAFPMVLLEAMSHGLPCVSFNCPTGPSDIITQGKDGILVEEENTETFASALSALIEDVEKRRSMSAQARKNVERYSEENIFKLWSDLFEKLKK